MNEYDRRLTGEILGFSQRLGSVLKALPPEYHLKRESNIRFIFHHQTEDKRINLGVKLDFERSDATFLYSLPRNFKLPLFGINQYQRAGESGVSSPYGIFPSDVFVDKKNRLCKIENEYYFNSYGERLKYEGVIIEGTESYVKALKRLEGTKEYPTHLLKVDREFSNDDSRYVKFDYGDYEKVGRWIRDIETGVYQPAVLNTLPQ